MTISPLGDAKIEAQGFVGSACSLATMPIERALSNDTGQAVAKPEMYSENTDQSKLTQGW